MPHLTTFTYDLASPDDTLLKISYVRHRIHDKDPNFPIFYDAEVEAALILEGFDLRRAAAYCLETIAASEVMIQKVIKILQFSTDGAKVAAELRANAAMLRQQAANDTLQNEATFDIAEWIVDDFSARQRIINEGLRGL